jgi:hypothetical protein
VHVKYVTPGELTAGLERRHRRWFSNDECSGGRLRCQANVVQSLKRSTDAGACMSHSFIAVEKNFERRLQTTKSLCILAPRFDSATTTPAAG